MPGVFVDVAPSDAELQRIEVYLLADPTDRVVRRPNLLLPRVARGTLREVLVGPAHENDGRLTLFGALRTSMATCGYGSAKEFQKAELMVAPALQTPKARASSAARTSGWAPKTRKGLPRRHQGWRSASFIPSADRSFVGPTCPTGDQMVVSELA
ncbi:MAG: hypothetical protein ACRDYC_12335 [Acidimicrobiales bacterium]